ncbi:unnamed protein product [Didymodactylos carnosus]|uniref:Uncharacterized protein n=1 Tax=Didymodactylos carnosus TaxID=1234261 RepID=A0A8S2W2U8_9BILA|nr:unnamed protein product [Didymodactylos carnosus]CAF4403763.1 unnamed protein product [Didymodactylos carnosus]
MHLLALTLGALLVFTASNQGQAADQTAQQQAKKFLAKVNLTVSPNGTGYKWITLCQVKARVADTGFEEKENTQTCTYTAHGMISGVKENGEQWRCSYNSEFYASGTMLTYENEITNKYEAAIKLAGEAKYKAAVELLQSMESQHIQRLKVAANKDSAKLTATATGAAFFGGGGNCDLTLEGFVNQLF